MSVTSTTNRKSYSGDAVTTSFATNPVVFFDSSDLAVSVISALGVATALTENTHYTVTGGDGSTGTVNLAGGSAPYGAPAVGVTLLILRQLPLTQPVDFVQNDGSDAEVQETAYDRLTMMVQQLNEVDSRAFKLPPVETGSTALTELPFDRASKFLAFDASKNPIASSGAVEGTVPVSAFMATVLDDATDADARTTLGAVGLTGNETIAGVKTFTGQQRWAKGADVASAAALTLGTDGNYFDITGTTGITSIGTLGVGTVIKLHFDGILTLTHQATDLVLPGGVNITTAAGDEAEFVEYATGDWRCTSYTKASGPRWVLGTAVASTSGTAIDFTGLPANIAEIIVMYYGVSTNGTSNYLIQLGDAGGIENSGYVSGAWLGGSTDTLATNTGAFIVTAAINATFTVSGSVRITRFSGNKWVSSGSLLRSDGGGNLSAGQKELSAEFTQIRITSASADTFDAGEVNILYRVA